MKIWPSASIMATDDLRGVTLDRIEHLDLQLLRTFDAIYQLRGATKAAHRLHLTPSAVSHSLAKLRKIFDDALFIRTSHALIPTAKSDDLHPQVASILSQIESLVVPSDIDPIEFNEEVNVTISDYGAFVLLPNVVKRLEREAPGLGLFCHAWAPDTEQRMENGEIDLAIGLRARHDKIEKSELFHDPLELVVRQKHPLSPSRKIDGKRLSKYELAFVAVAGEVPPQTFWDRQGIKSPVTLKLPYFLNAPMVVATSNRIVMLPRSIATSPYFRRDLRILPTSFKLPTITYSLFWHRRVQADPVLDWLRALIVDEAKKLDTRASRRQGK